VVELNEGDQLGQAPPGDDSKKARLRIDFTICCENATFA
jgi:hypothetical protein